MNYTYKHIWLINFPVMMSILIEQLINITDAIFLGHVGEVELGASAIAGIWYLAIYMLGFGFSLGFAGRYCTAQRRTALFRNREDILSRIVFPVGTCCLFVSVLQAVFSDYSKQVNCFCGSLSCRD